MSWLPDGLTDVVAGMNCQFLRSFIVAAALEERRHIVVSRMIRRFGRPVDFEMIHNRERYTRPFLRCPKAGICMSLEYCIPAVRKYWLRQQLKFAEI